MIDSDSMATRFWRLCYDGVQWEKWGEVNFVVNCTWHKISDIALK